MLDMIWRPSIVAHPEGGFVVAGAEPYWGATIDDPPGTDNIPYECTEQPWIARVDADGSVRWRSRADTCGRHTDLEIADDGTIWTKGTSTRLSPRGYDVWLARWAPYSSQAGAHSCSLFPDHARAPTSLVIDTLLHSRKRIHRIHLTIDHAIEEPPHGKPSGRRKHLPVLPIVTATRKLPGLRDHRVLDIEQAQRMAPRPIDEGIVGDVDPSAWTLQSKRIDGVATPDRQVEHRVGRFPHRGIVVGQDEVHASLGLATNSHLSPSYLEKFTLAQPTPAYNRDHAQLPADRHRRRRTRRPLSLAKLLTEKGFADVTLLEKNSRVGGKSSTFHHEGIGHEMVATS